MLSLFIFYLLSPSSIVCALFFNIEYNNSSLINNAAIDIMNCSRNETYTLGLMNSSKELFSAIFSPRNRIAVTVITMTDDLTECGLSSKDLQAIRPAPGNSPDNQLNYFIITVSSSKIFYTTLRLLRESTFWNPYAYYIILEGTPSENYCKNYSDFLRILWLFDILNGIFICIHENKELFLYAYNPYNARAPEPWMFFNTDPYIKDNPFSIFNCTFDRNIICRDIFFEKATTLDGYKIRMNARPFPPLVSFNSSKICRTHSATNCSTTVKLDDWDKLFKGYDSEVMRTIFKFLNTTSLRMQIHSEDEALGEGSDDNESSGILKDHAKSAINAQLNPDNAVRYEFKNDMVDIGLNTRYILLKGKQTLTYPFTPATVNIITNNRGFMPIIARITEFFSTGIIVSIPTIAALVVLILMNLGGQHFGSAVLNALRFLLGIAVPHIPSGLPARIMIGCMMPYFLIIVITLDVSVVHVLTVSRSIKNIDTFEDLEAARYTIHAGTGYAQTYNSVIKNLQMHKEDHCLVHVLNDSQAACIDDSTYVKYAAAQYGSLHIMKEALNEVYTAYPVRDNWPLKFRMNLLLSRLVENGYINLLLARNEVSSNLKIRVAAEKQVSTETIETVNPRQLLHFFVFLGIGHSIATMVFFTELIVFKFNKQRRNSI